MSLKDAPIQRKLMTMILITSGAVLLLTCAVLFAYEFLTFRQTTVQHLSTLGEIIAANSTASLTFENEDDAAEILSALKAESHILAGGLYDKSGKLFSKYPASLPNDAFPGSPQGDGYRFEQSHLIGFQPVLLGGNRIGTLYLKSDVAAIYERFRLYGGIVVLVVVASLLLAYVLSKGLQKQISQPILALAQTAKAVSDRQDYSVRATKFGGDEVGLLTDAFNQMLAQIHVQNEALSDSEGRMRAVLNSALSAVIVIDASGRVTDWNSRAETMFGWTRVEVLGQEIAGMIIPPEYREMYRVGLDHFLSTREGPLLGRTIELSALRRNGTEFPVELSVSALKTGDATTFCGFITDITERKDADEKVQAQLSRLNLLSRTTRAIGERLDLPSIFQVVIRSLEDNLPIDFGCICLYDPSREALTVISVGSRSEALAGNLEMTPQSGIPIDENGLSRCVRGELVYESDISELQFAFPQRLARGGLRSLVIAPLLVESKVFGVLVAARVSAHSFSSGECEFLRQLSEHVGLASHQVQLYTALQQAYDDLRQTQQTVMQQERLRALGQMASGIAHDINNALSPVALYTESLLENETNLSERAREYLVTIQRAIDDVAQTVARMREFYRSREPPRAMVPVHLNNLAQQVVDLTRARWSDMPLQRGSVIRLQLDLAPDIPAIMGAESEIRDALTNLIFNAVDAMPGGGALTLRTRVAEGAMAAEDASAPRRVLVEIEDTGTGMDEETRRRCLEPFFTTKGERGTGLGLAMVYGMVERHGAEIEIESERGKGTTMRLIFPGATKAGEVVVQSYAPPAPGQRLRLLLVDDDPLLIKSLRDILEGDGHSITAADGGQAGIDAFRAAQERNEPFAAVITDLGMPYVDGRQVASAIKTASPSTRIILLTGWGQRLVEEGDIPQHVDCVLSKPPKLRELRGALAACGYAGKP
jgi:PAS domain S-box-containing protein